MCVRGKKGEWKREKQRVFSSLAELGGRGNESARDRTRSPGERERPTGATARAHLNSHTTQSHTHTLLLLPQDALPRGPAHRGPYRLSRRGRAGGRELRRRGRRGAPPEIKPRQVRPAQDGGRRARDGGGGEGEGFGLEGRRERANDKFSGQVGKRMPPLSVSSLTAVGRARSRTPASIPSSASFFAVADQWPAEAARAEATRVAPAATDAVSGVTVQLEGEGEGGSAGDSGGGEAMRSRGPLAGQAG